MGKKQSKEENSAEMQIVHAELSIPFSHLASKRVDQALHRYMTNMRLNENQLNESFRSLRMGEMHELTPQLQNLMKRYKEDEEGSFNGIRISTMGILLGQANLREKVELLFANYGKTNISFPVTVRLTL